MGNKIDLAGISGDYRHSSVSGTAGSTDIDGATKISFFCSSNVNFVSNDSSSYSMLVNFDEPVGRAGTFEIKAGEAVSDLKISCKTIYVQGVGGDVPFRAVGS